MKSEIKLLDICKALANNEFIFYYQPIVSLVTGKIISAEALLRWKHPNDTVLSPAAFIPLALEKGFITEITREMFPKMVDDLVIINSYNEKLKISFNLTAQDLQTENLAKWMRGIMAQKGINPNKVYAEIVENVLMPPIPKIKKTILDLSREGFSLVLNDFSAGNTSVQHLSQLPLSMLKLSMNIVKQGPTSRMDFRILRHIVSMGHQLRLGVIAEGVEDKEIYDLILSTGCTAVQGYFLSHPLPLTKFVDLIKKKPRWVNYPFGLEYLAQIDHIDLRRDVIREALIIYTQHDEEIQQRAIERLPHLEHENCLLGEWYIEVVQDYHSSPDFIRLEKIHAQFHETAQEILRLAKKGNGWESIERLIDQLTIQSSEIMNILQRLATNKLLEHYE